MSRNFELLRKLGKDQELLGDVAVPERAVEAAAGAGAESSSDVVPLSLPAPVTMPCQPVPAAPPALAPPEDGLEEVTSLAQQIFLAPGADAPRVVVFASPEPATGCTWVCARTAEALARRTAGSVCLVDANLRNPGLHRQYDVEPLVGLSDALQQLEPIGSFAVRVNLPNLFLVPAGASLENPHVGVTSDRMRLRVAELRSSFDFVLIDTPAMDFSSDALCLGPLAEGVVLVLEAHSTRKQNARKSVVELQAAHAKVLGAVLNRRTYPIPEAVYKRL
jgi:Mrp family chromosome partitioning ATPase